MLLEGFSFVSSLQSERYLFTIKREKEEDDDVDDQGWWIYLPFSWLAGNGSDGTLTNTYGLVKYPWWPSVRV